MDLLGSVFNHLVLPPVIPGVQDTNIDGISNDILQRMIHASDTALGLTTDVSCREAYQNLQASFRTCLELNRGRLEKTSLLKHFKQLVPGQVLILYINEQNAGLLIRRDIQAVQEFVIFESFEASATASEVIATGHVMQWDFPGRSVRVALHDFVDDSFQESLTGFLEQASMESLYSLQASTKKAGVSVGEIRDTTNPALISQMLMSLLEAVGSHYKAPILRKQVRDDVNLGVANIPWRRLPFWLVLRVATQRQLCFTLKHDKGQIAYKCLMAIVLTELLDESVEKIRDPHKVVHLRTKLARRMAKLEVNKERNNIEGNNWLKAVSTLVAVSLENANAKVKADWNSFKRRATRHTPPLPTHAPTDSLKLTLPNSGRYLDAVLSNKLSRQSYDMEAALPSPLDQRTQRSQQFMDEAFKLAALEHTIEQDCGLQQSTTLSNKDRCLELENRIKDIFTAVGLTYKSNPTQNSAVILGVFSLWVELDRAAIENHCLLSKYAPVFQPELLDVLQLASKSAMERLQKIQKYLADRRAKSTRGSILEASGQDSIALRYVATSKRLQSLEHRILASSDDARQKKHKEHTKLCDEYDEHTENIAASKCRCTWEDDRRIVRGCTKCWHWRKRNRMSVAVHEEFLPDKKPERDTIVFELAIPGWLSAYRDATWEILSKLAHPSKPKGTRPEIQLDGCKPLKPFMEPKVKRLSLASKIKCFEQTHYKFSQGKVPLERVVVPFGARFQLYDHELRIWVEDLTNQLTLEHLCGIQIPHSLLSILPEKPHPPTVVAGPTSYEIQANQAATPKDVSMQAFCAFQKLYAGRRRRWPNILVEMCSSNLNLSDESTVRLICQLAAQAGPRMPDEPLRAVHEVFKYPVFTDRLRKTLENLLESIGTNWREHNIMELVITLALRLASLSSPECLGKTILVTARNCLLGWISLLQNKVKNSKDSAEAQHYSSYGLYAALLCRETFAILVGSGKDLCQDELSAWVQASIAMQENLLLDISQLSGSLRSILLRDAKMAYHLQDLIKNSMKHHRATVGAEILRALSNTFLGGEEACCSWTFLNKPNDRWIGATSPGTRPDRLHFNFIQGHLLVNGKSRSKLPPEIAEDEDVRFIFGDQHLLTYPSREPGMSHRLARPINKITVHFGLRKNRAVIRATRYHPKSRAQETCEFVSQSVFSRLGRFDLPAELVHNCGHWLNINTQRLEIRSGLPDSPSFWVTRRRDWIIHVPRRRAFRGIGGSNLIDPESEIFAKIKDIFSDFEEPHKLTVYQPQNSEGRLTVELKHLDLRFEVDEDKYLRCQQLHAVIDPNQDAGTWYGLKSKIVMRDVKTRDRSIIVPLGRPTILRDHHHVSVCIHEGRNYAKFEIDEIVGRLVCSPEPWLIYTKALYHAMTSFCLPDTLTGRKGSTEALAILKSGTALPWTNLSRSGHTVIEEFKQLVPRREYYPPNLKRLQKVVWDPKLTVSIQYDEYQPVTEAITKRSNDLGVFATGTALNLTETSHLCHRGRGQRQIYDPLTSTEARYTFTQVIYTPRDRITSPQAVQVYRISRVVVSRCSHFQMSRTLSSMLELSKVIGGFPAPDSHSPIASAKPLISQIEDPINKDWGNLVDFCRRRATQHGLLFRLALLAFSKAADMDAIHSLAAFGLVAKIRDLTPPKHELFVDFPSSEQPSVELLAGLITPVYPKFQPLIDKNGKEGLSDSNKCNIAEHDALCRDEGEKLAKRIQQLWPVASDNVPLDMLAPPVAPHVSIDIEAAWDMIKPEWKRRHANVELSDYIRRVDEALMSLGSRGDTATLVIWAAQTPLFSTRLRYQSNTAIIQLWVANSGLVSEVTKPGKHFCVAGVGVRSQTTDSKPRRTVEVAGIDRILQEFEQSNDNLRKHYAGDLRESLTALEAAGQQTQLAIRAHVPNLGAVYMAIKHAQIHLSNTWNAITRAFAAGDSRYAWLKLGAIQPVATATDLLKTLRTTAGYNFQPLMKDAIVNYGIAITALQRLNRIRRALQRHDEQALNDELCTPGHEKWSPHVTPDWLLLEIDGDILIRAEQAVVARAIIDPKSGNRVLQMNCGKGKTSCIIPMVETVLADGQSLSRVIVPKALLMQTTQIMQSRLGGLVGRPVFFVPFSRRTSTKREILRKYEDLHRKCQQCHGIMLTSHETLLSYKLCGWQEFVDSKMSTAVDMIRFQDWLTKHCRDVLDECDFTLSVKTQLNYPSGPVMPVDFHPYRWQLAQELLGLVVSHLRALQHKHPRGIQVTPRRDGASFPIVSFLRTGTENTLHDLLVADICSGRLTLLRPAYSTTQQTRSAVHEVLYKTDLSAKSLGHAARCFANTSLARDVLLLVRGLLLHRILVLCLGKRWNIQYGLHPARDPVAVPYEAKGKPSEQAEYGHPDVAILFTCLSFYYAGLTIGQLVQGLEHILHHSDDPAAQYEWWATSCTHLPKSLRHWNIINTDDKGQMEQLWSHLKWNRAVINHYLNHFVFPLHARQFEVKLQACSWDIPIYSEKDNGLTRTTGFSGTNDNRLLLPLTISQRDLPELQHTSAEVLSYLLQHRNRHFVLTADEKGKRLTEKALLRNLKENDIRLLIDVGAYISEMENNELAQAWLDVDSDAKAAVYFGDDNRAWVHYRSNAKDDVPLLATPFAGDLSGCVVFLDEAHTRGVDLKLPPKAVGAVTLALKLTKDYLVQAAMRLRQLRTTQSIRFYGPPEVDQSIRDFCSLSQVQNIDSSHVVSWLLEQTCRSVEDLRGLYVAQGIDFCRRTDTVWHCKKFATDNTERQKLLQVLKQPERQTLKQLYGHASERSSMDSQGVCLSSQLNSFMEKLLLFSKDQQDSFQSGALEEVEQERQVEVQVEKVRQVEKPERFEALTYPGIHPDIVNFAHTGKLAASQPIKVRKPGFEHAFAFVGRTSIAKRFGVHETSSKLFVSREFGNTVKPSKGSKDDNNFLRPVEWIVWSPTTETALVVIPEEVEFFMQVIRDHKREPLVHLLPYAAPVTKGMIHFNTLEFCPFPELPKGRKIPDVIRIELGILAGRLYVDRTEWKVVTEYVTKREPKFLVSGRIADDPAAFLLEWLTIRRKAVDVLHTPMGYICTGREMETGDSSDDEDIPEDEDTLENGDNLEDADTSDGEALEDGDASEDWETSEDGDSPGNGDNLDD